MSFVNETDDLLQYVRLNRNIPDNRFDEVWEAITGNYEINIQRFISNTKSPIEKIMGACLFHSISRIRNNIRGWYIRLSCQEPITFDGTNYIVDFGIHVEDVNGNELIKIIVECDGHDFHKKTKEQAQHDKERDRKFTQNGYKVLRFTGSEIYRDPFKCSLEVGDTILDCYKQSRGEAKDG